MGLQSARTSEDGAIVELGWSDGTIARFHALWLRDNSLDDETRSAANGQRLVTILDLPPETSAEGVQLTAAGDLLLSFLPEQKTTGLDAGRDNAVAERRSAGLAHRILCHRRRRSPSARALARASPSLRFRRDDWHSPRFG
jgi:hypothetical protein